MSTKRALHFVFKVADRNNTTKFYKDVLGMKVLRHEEFEKGCEAMCNGPYDGKWSKSMVGFGPEDGHFVVELTYNYGIGSYKLGNDFMGITINSKAAVENVKKTNYKSETDGTSTIVEAPGGYKFTLDPKEKEGDPVEKVTLASSDITRSVEFWKEKCGMTLFSKTDDSAVLGFGENQCKLEFKKVDKVDHASAFGRIAFSCPKSELPGIEKVLKDSGETILTPLVSLDTPGKATVQVVIVGDPDGHEICFVGDEAFKELSQVDPKADGLLEEEIKNDKSDEWFAKKKRTKESA